MKHLRFRVIILSCWLILCFSAERLADSLDFSDLAYVFILTIVVTILFASRIVKISLWVIMIIPVVIFLILKAWAGAISNNTDFAITVFEVCAVIVTVLLSYWMSMAIFDFENAIAKIMIGRRDRMPEPDMFGQGMIYREVRRARNHQRPLALMTVAVDEKSLKFSINRMVQEVQLSMMKQYMQSEVSKLLCDQMEDCAIIVQNNDRFLIALPETKPEEVPVIIDRLRQQVAEHVGVKLEFGTATLPKDSLTFEGLVDKATIEMRTNLESTFLVNVDRTPSDHTVSAAK